MKKILLLFISICIFAIVSCSNLEPKDSPDPRFTGTWVGSRTGRWIPSLNTWTYYSYHSYKFHDSNIIGYYGTRKEYGVEDYKNPYIFTYEWKLENDVYYYKLHDNEFSDWRVFDIQYIDSSKIIIEGVELKRS